MTTIDQAGTVTPSASAGIHDSSFRSQLDQGVQRFLAHVIEHGLECGQRTPEDFIRHFPPMAIMQALKDEPDLRANIVVISTGVKKKVAVKKSAESCGMDVQIALDEGETDAETIVTLFDPDDRVRYLGKAALWSYVTEDEFWKVDASNDSAAHTRAAGHIAYMIQRALEDDLVTHRDVVEGIGVRKLTELLPRTELEKIISATLEAGHTGKAFAEKNLLDETPTAVLVQHIPLTWLWDHVLVPKVAEARGLADAKPSSPEPEVIVESTPEPEPAEPAEAAPAEAAPAAAHSASNGNDGSADLDLEVDAVLSDLDEDTQVRDQKAFKVPAPPAKRKPLGSKR